MRREAAKRAADEERLRKEEEKKKRQQEEREREMERERKKKDLVEKLRKEREEKERKTKEEREARLAKEREDRAERERIEKEKREEREKVEKEKRLVREKEEKVEKEAKEKLAAQQRAAAITQAQATTVKQAVRPNAAASSSSSALATPVVGKVNASSSSSSVSLPRSPNPAVNGGPANGKKAVTKHITPPSTVPSPPGVVGQGPRPPQQQIPSQPQPQQPQANMSRPPHLPPLNAMNPQQIPPHLPPPPQSGGMMYGHPQMMPALSPRVGNFPPMGQYPFGAPNMQQHHPPGTPLPSGMSRSFNAGPPPPFDPAFNRGMSIGIGVPIGGVNSPAGAPSPIGPPKPKTPLASTSAPGAPMLAPGQGRRGSVAVLNTPTEATGPGPITRPIAPIARPPGGTPAECASSGSGSPNRRSPSPKGTLGSSALAADDDEVVAGTGPRRVMPGTPIGGMGMSVGVPAGQTWGPASPRPGMMTPWGPSGFSPSPARAAPNSANHFHQQGVPPPIGSGSLWTNNQTGGGDSWHPQNTPGVGGFFPGPPYMNHNAAASSTPHTGS